MHSAIIVYPIAVLFLLLCYLAYIELFAYRFPKSIPLVGFRREAFSVSRASLRQVLGTSRTLAEGYDQYGANNSPYVVPDTTFRPQVMLPQTHVKWLCKQPESILSTAAVRTERNGVRYLPTNLDPKSTLLFIDTIIGQSLSQKLGLIHSDMYDEVRYAVDSTMGSDVDSWRTLDLNKTLSTIINRASSRVLFGLSLCRNEAYLRILQYFIIFMGISTLVVGQLPPYFARPICGIFLSIPTLVFKRLSLSYIIPVVKESLRRVESEKENSETSEKSSDFVTQSCKSIKKNKISVQSDMSAFLAEQILILAFAAMATTGAAATNLFLDILSDSPQARLYDALHDEATSILESDIDWKSPSSMERLMKTESTIRESLRRNTLQSRALLRQVMPQEGIGLPDGSHVPHGTWLGVPVQAIQNDERLYPNPHRYDALRFVPVVATGTGEVEDILSPLLPHKLEAAQASDTFLSFSYGRSLCPGRWFAARLLKFMVAYITANYEIKPLMQRPQNISFGDASIPSFTTQITLRRRRHSELNT